MLELAIYAATGTAARLYIHASGIAGPAMRRTTSCMMQGIMTPAASTLASLGAKIPPAKNTKTAKTTSERTSPAMERTSVGGEVCVKAAIAKKFSGTSSVAMSSTPWLVV